MAISKPPYPREVRRSLDWGRKECRAEGGTVIYEPGIVRTADLTGDGRPDFVVDYRAGRCSGYLGMFNGTGGWDLAILIARAGRATREVFRGRVRGYTVLPGRGPKRVAFDLHGGFCGLAGADECRKTRTITTRPFAFKDR